MTEFHALLFAVRIQQISRERNEIEQRLKNSVHVARVAEVVEPSNRQDSVHVARVAEVVEPSNTKNNPTVSK